ncbi:S-formylglutathione hydrolase [Brytella acorum]|uniref:S-formylglutathione hydrolase n=1 Tax=Brytella acorum TaxID=2959299 RepID=A0AA35XWC8_9PROT|nr:S-formylglutathione hydrolase [Brytella acorum]MDF3624213.1 S-formylglutathione hydrolase [Brytella acorum]CAI9120719.1 S-formylglutathione hydrolase [Brytella acorum]
MAIETLSETLCCRGRLGFYRHASETLGLDATFGVFLPEIALSGTPVPVVHLLAGLTCTQETFFIKANAVRFAAKYNLALVATDTSPRGAGTPGEDESYDLGAGAGFYLDATAAPWAQHYRMGSYIAAELPALTEAHFPLDGQRRGIMGHSMGGHGALVHALRAPEKWKTVSAFAPIMHPAAVPWGEKAFTAYLGEDRADWRAWDATALLEAGRTHPGTILIDQGLSDQFLDRELRPELFEAAASRAGQGLRLRRHPGYDHSYWFIQTFIEDHMAHHAVGLKG